MVFTLYLSAMLLVCVAIAHSYLGERYILCRLFKRNNLPKLFGSDDFTKRTLRFAWHLTSIAWFGFAGIVVALIQPELDKLVVAQIIAATFGIHFFIALIGSKGKHLSWVLFATVSILMLMSKGV
ncbi:hypothetical protein PSECIP111854_00520 [Pseudoalteromonas sp. CIP111854]|uniref:Uncharacterized protein n=1 Tax=Pseudoalteromonas holothuriae TaxID=2963714 RepID=A0A9W4QRS9_9GAMM|nr:hypothetical protein [Pseudoalteromonas sp. CIP111854]CAH9050387.1 hypothetical protein PSECIP111854_00520 [Pseudoalteromonas sp. CIP111854]